MRRLSVAPTALAVVCGLISPAFGQNSIPKTPLERAYTLALKCYAANLALQANADGDDGDRDKHNAIRARDAALGLGRKAGFSDPVLAHNEAYYEMVESKKMARDVNYLTATRTDCQKLALSR